MKFLIRAFEGIIKATAVLGSLLLAFMACVIIYQVFMRYFFNVAPLWVNDLVEYILLGSTFLGGAYVLKEEKHIEVDLVVTRFEQKNQFLIKVITSFIGAAVCLVLTCYGILTVWDNYKRGVEVYKAVDFPKYIILIPICIGSLLLTIQFCRRARFYMKERRKSSMDMDKLIDITEFISGA